MRPKTAACAPIAIYSTLRRGSPPQSISGAKHGRNQTFAAAALHQSAVKDIPNSSVRLTTLISTALQRITLPQPYNFIRLEDAKIPGDSPFQTTNTRTRALSPTGWIENPGAEQAPRRLSRRALFSLNASAGMRRGISPASASKSGERHHPSTKSFRAAKEDRRTC